MTSKQREIKRKRRVIEYAEQSGNIQKTCRYFGVGRSLFYLWRARYREFGDEGLANRRRVAHDYPNKTPAEVVEKILQLRRTYHTCDPSPPVEVRRWSRRPAEAPTEVWRPVDATSGWIRQHSFFAVRY